MKIREAKNCLERLPRDKDSVPMMETDFISTRCPNCNQRFFDIAFNSIAIIQIKCPRCKRTYSIVFDDIGSNAA